MIDNLFNKPKSRRVAIILALVGTVTPLAGLHKLYLGQPLWGLVYLLLWATPIPRIACAIEAVWYLAQDGEEFNRRFNVGLLSMSSGGDLASVSVDPYQVSAIADSLRELDRLRQEGLMSEYEFEQKRRQLLDRIA
ncbi:MAG: SHOCT domain-containing protein [Oscillatoria sp. PMC 1051.18]|uniref:SHOCT domain-containing protein n=1 Tax=Oscillatoria salina TaxID=331517 RepID=UPI0013BC5A71|nr:SHOCT domain-containing protein [Oscillatoria salina]MBZ8181485.1 hypothetical protein [Oscillatoria salina IIICB1]MEC4892596.1 SHOCT domain-containing protein [Oscillatoria sp. PMC 1050.18]MEC5032030.1 SHOCT domain-containing protein [Oscillatoria sp. PMC 1051.18]NET87500.1 hypothetical protein [Kamptonema sp. SIO1D9]